MWTVSLAVALQFFIQIGKQYVLRTRMGDYVLIIAQHSVQS